MANRAFSVERDDDALFVENGVPINFCFHTSITQGRNAITRDIQRHGGRVVASERDANVLLIDEQQDLAFFRSRYYHSTELYRLALYVEPRGFVQRCIRGGLYTHDKPVKQGMPGVAPGTRARVPFTEQDKDGLAYYLATKLPTRDGRLGNKAYQELEQLGTGNDPTWAWAKRHTWHSWREHYKRNRASMDARIHDHVERLKDVGHHLGHDPRRHRREEGEEGTESEGEWQRQQVVRQNRQIGKPAAAAGRGRDQAARDYRTRHELNLISDDEGEEGPQRLGRPRSHPDAHPRPNPRNAQMRRAHVSEAPSDEDRASGVEADRAEGTPLREEGEELEEFAGSDLFGDQEYEKQLRRDFDDGEVPQAQPYSPRASPIPEQEGAPPSTQATLIAQSPLAEKERPFASSPTRAVELSAFRVAALEQIFPSSSQQMMVVAQQRVEQRSLGGASTQRGPPRPREKRTRGGTALADAPYRNTRARSRSVDPLPQPGRESPKGRGKGKAKEVLAPIEDIALEEEGGEEFVEGEIGPVSTTNDGPSRRETLRDEESVEELLDPSDDGADLDLDIPMHQDVKMEEPEVDEEQGGSQRDDGLKDDEDAEIAPQIESRHQDVDMGQPSDSDDAETHGSLIRGAAGGDGQHGSPSEEGPNEDDMDRIEQMERMSFLDPPAQPQLRMTRSMATAARAQPVNPRRVRSEHQVRVVSGPNTFPSPGTEARAVVDRVQEAERSMPYEPPTGTRASKAAGVKPRRGQ